MSDTLQSRTIAFVGAGSMAEAIIRGLVRLKKTKPEQIIAFNRSNKEQLDRLGRSYGIRTASIADRRQEIASADIVVIAMKPKDVVEALSGLRGIIHKDQLLVSVVAGLSIATISDLLQTELPIARTMPNTSSTIGLGATGISFSGSIDDTGREMVLDMFRSTGEALVVEESRLDIVTGVSGSGPAYIYYMMEAMIAGGVRGGLSEDAARLLTVQTVLGAASMVKTTGEDPADLRRKVTSPNGTTQAALETLDKHGFTGAVVAAVLRCAERAAELGASIKP